jgi:hypothetical protein
MRCEKTRSRSRSSTINRRKSCAKTLPRGHPFSDSEMLQLVAVHKARLAISPFLVKIVENACNSVNLAQSR